MHRRHLPLAFVCDRVLDDMPARADGRQRWCESCERSVHDLSRYTEAEAREFMRARSGRRCIAYPVDARGQVRFRRTQLDRVGVALTSLALAVSVACLGAGLELDPDTDPDRWSLAQAPASDEPRAQANGTTAPSERGRPFELPVLEPEPASSYRIWMGEDDPVDGEVLLPERAVASGRRAELHRGLTSMDLQAIERMTEASSSDAP